MSELQETVDWLGALLKEKFPECWTNGVTSSAQCANELLASWKREVGEIPEATCPDIDKVIKEVDKAMTACRTIDRSKCENCSDYGSDAYYELSGIEDDLEKLRTDNQQLRELGEFWYEKCKALLAASAAPKGNDHVEG